MVEVTYTAPDLLRLAGSVDVITVGEFRQLLSDAVEQAAAAGRPLLMLDVHDLELRDATGLGALLAGYRRARRAGVRLRLVRPSPELSRLLVVSRFYRLLDIAPVEGDLPAPRPASVTAEEPIVPL
jgi:anti-sigma B factor antagonist